MPKRSSIVDYTWHNRTSVVVNDDITGVGDADNRKESEKCAALSANLKIRRHNLVGNCQSSAFFILMSFSVPKR